MFWGFAAIILVLVADQYSKYITDSEIANAGGIAICEYFNIVKVWNTGVSFSMFNDYGTAGLVILSIVSVTISGVLLYWMMHETDRCKIISLGLIIGGALGNVIDRIRFGAVMDFLDFHYKSYHWPAFNVADSFICIGAGILIFLELLDGYKKGLNKS